MGMAKVIEISYESEESFEDAMHSGIEEANEMFAEWGGHVVGAWIKEQELKIEDGEIVAYKVNMQVTAQVEQQAAQKSNNANDRKNERNGDRKVVYAAPAGNKTRR